MDRFAQQITKKFMKKFTKTLILFSSSDIGGAEKSLSRLAKRGEKREFFLGSLSGDGSLLHNEENSNNYVHQFGFKNSSFFNLIRSCMKALTFSKKEKIDNVYICGFKACSIIRIASIFIKTPKIFHAIRWNPISKNKNDKIFRIFERIFIFNTNGWICNSKSAKDTLTSFCGIPENKTISIYNGIDTPRYKENILQRKNIVLSLANFAPRKGIIEYLNVIERVIIKNNNVKFIIAGRDDMKGLVQKEINKRKLEEFIDTPGFIKETSDLFKVAKIMVMPSLLPEGCPTSVLEGMAEGLPVIGYNIRGLNELIIDNKTGFLIPFFDEKEMANKIIKLLLNPDLIERLGTNGYNEVIRNFSLSEMLKKHRRVFNSF